MPLQLEIVSPERRAYADEVDMVVVPGIDGELAVSATAELVRAAVAVLDLADHAKVWAEPARFTAMGSGQTQRCEN